MDVVICAHKLMLLDVEKKMMIGRRNAWSMKYRVQEQEENQRGPGAARYRRQAETVTLTRSFGPKTLPASFALGLAINGA